MTRDNQDEQFDENLLQSIVRSILVSRVHEGATLEEIKNDYYMYSGEEFPIRDFRHLTLFVLSIPNVTLLINKQGTFLFGISKCPEASQHVLDMISKDKRSREYLHYNRGTKRNDSRKPTYFQARDRKPKCQNRRITEYNRTSSTNLSKHSLFIDSDHGNNSAHIYDFPIIGDDFMLSLAKIELNCHFKKGNKILKSGYCVSGQTISDAINRIENAENLGSSVIINLGSVDILHGHDLLDMKETFTELVHLLESKGVFPIITTLAPLANYGHRPLLKKNLERFNQFLRNNYEWCVLDLWKCMVNEHGHTLYECYQPEARHVTGSIQPHVLWNKLGRQRILKFLKNGLADI